MWCKKCSIETNEQFCPVCGEPASEDKPIKIYWCKECNIPIIQYVNQSDEGICPLCGKNTKYLCADIRPVFPEERLLIECLLGKNPNEYFRASVWASNNKYYIDGKTISISSKQFANANADTLRSNIYDASPANSYEFFNRYISLFVKANKTRFDSLVDEAQSFVVNSAKRFPQENIVVSFSGGKDSTVTADIAIKALSEPSLVHIFGNTTLECLY